MTKGLLTIAFLFFAAVDRTEGDRLFAAGDWAGAREAYEAALEGAEGADAADLLDRIGLTLKYEGRPWEAERYFTRSIETHETAAAHLHRGEAFYDAGVIAAGAPGADAAEVMALMGDAARALERSLELDRESAEAWLMLGYVEWYRGNGEAELAAYRRALEVEPGHPVGAERLAAILLGSGQNEEAKAILLGVSPDRRTTGHLDLLARIAEAGGDGDAALDLRRRAVLLAPADEAAWYGLWRLAVAEKRYTALIDFARARIEAAPEAMLPRYYLAYGLWRAGKPEEALAEFRRAMERAGDDLRPAITTGDLLAEDLGRTGEAIEIFLDVLAKEPGNLRARQVLTYFGLDRARERDFETADRIYEALKAGDPSEWTHWTNHALVRKEAGDEAGAERLYREAADRFPFEPQIPNDLALLLLGMGRDEAAREAFEEALARDSEFLDSLENLGALARLAGKPDVAIGYFRTALERARRDGLDESRQRFRRYLDMVAHERAPGR